MSAQSSVAPTTSSVSAGQLARAGALGTLIGAVAAAAVFGIARAVGDPMLVTAGGSAASEVTLPLVLFSAVFGGVAGFVVALLLRRTSRPRRNFLVVTGIGLVLSFVSPALSASNASTAIWLNVMHVAVAAGVIPLLARALPRTGPARTR